jgi:hypothetical protein
LLCLWRWRWSRRLATDRFGVSLSCKLRLNLRYCLLNWWLYLALHLWLHLTDHS